MPFSQPLAPQHSEEVQEIIGAVPHWLIRWGICLFFVVLLLILLFSAIIKSPDIVPATLRIDAENRPQEVIARKEGKLARLFVKADQQVHKDEILGFIESTADHEEVLALSKLMDSLQTQILEEDNGFVNQVRFNTRTHYGELQPALQEFYLAFLQFKAYTPDGLYARKEEMIKKEIGDLKLLEQHLYEQQKINQEEFALSQKEYKIHKELAEAKVISPMEFRQQEMKYLDAKLPLQSTKSAIINSSLSQSLKLKELMDMEQQIAEQRAMFLSGIQRFKSEIDGWKKEHVLISERDGKVVFQQVLEQSQWLRMNEPVMYITDQQASKPFGVLTLGQQAFGKIKTGQDVLIKLNAYPSQEYGLLRGKIVYISNVLTGDSAYTAKVALPQKTSYNKAVNLQIGLVAQAEVVTEQQSLLARIFNSTRDILVNK